MDIQTQEQLIALEKLRYQYLLDQNYTAFKTLCHPQLSYMHSSGKADDYAGYIGKCETNFYHYHLAEIRTDRVDLLGDVALLFGELRAEFSAGTDEKKLHNKVLSIWKKEQGEWKFYAYQPTAII